MLTNSYNDDVLPEGYDTWEDYWDDNCVGDCPTCREYEDDYPEQYDDDE